MNGFEVIAGWLHPEQVIGHCVIERARGKEVISFSFDDVWLKDHPGFFLDPDIYAAPGRQYPPGDKPCFGFLSDIAPDRWGRKLMDRRERLDASAEDRSVRKLMESDYITGVHDLGRMGAIRLRSFENGEYISSRPTNAVPPMTMLRRLENASLQIEKRNQSATDKWFRDLFEPGSSLGGARPKANVMDEAGALWIAKFPSRHDMFNVGAWEMVVHELALLSDINVPEAKCMRLSDAGDTFLVKRFDREGERRIHFASGMTMLGRTDNAEISSDYTELAGVLEQIGSSPAEDLRELWRRAVFNSCVSNTDDHLRNHGFLLLEGGWRLSPAYDINPNYQGEYMALMMNGDDRCNTQRAVDASDFFRITRGDAVQYVTMVKNIVRDNWKKLAKKRGISNSECKEMEPAFIR